MDTRQLAKQKLSMCGADEDLAALEKKVKDLSVVDLSKKVQKLSHDLNLNPHMNLQNHMTCRSSCQRSF